MSTSFGSFMETGSQERIFSSSLKGSEMKRLFRNTITSSDRHVISQFLLDSEKETRECQSEINRLKASIHLLENRKDGLKKTMEKCRSLLAPVHRLPPEILMQIFSIVCKENVLTNKFTPYAMRMARVCGRWRDIVLSTPSLWSCIRIPVRQWKGKMPSLVIMVDIFLRTSKMSPLDIELDMAFAEQGTPENDGLPLITRLSQECARWKTFSLLLPRSFAQNQLLFPDVMGKALPLLQCLRLKAYGQSTDANGAHTSMPAGLRGLFTLSPSLRTVFIGPGRYLHHYLRLPWNQIRTLEISSASTRAASSFLKSIPNLQNLVITKPKSSHGHGETVTFASNSVQSAEFNFYLQETMELTMAYLALPNLKCIQICGGDGTGPLADWKALTDSSAILSFLSRSACQITTLSLKWLPMTDDQAMELLQNIPTLLDLHIEEVTKSGPNVIITTPFLRRLAVDHENYSFKEGSVFLPSLTNVSLVVRSEGLSDVELFRAVSSRHIPDLVRAQSIGVACLRTASIAVIGGEVDLSSLECFRDAGLRLSVVHRVVP